MPHRPVVLTILDGWGMSARREGNAPLLAKTPTLDRLMASCPLAKLAASGVDVGLPEGQIGNSEVGHTNIGAGRVVWQTLPRIDKAIEDGSFFAIPALVDFMVRLKASGGRAHLMGLISPGGVHSHQRHVSALAMLLSKAGIEVEIHAFLDGRDVAPGSGPAAMAQLLEDVAPLSGVRVATVCGRFFAMDRDHRWERVERAFRLLADGEGARFPGALAAIDAAYENQIGDEFLEPAVVADYPGMMDGDGLISANFRSDRMRELLRALLDPEFTAFDSAAAPHFSATLGMISYSEKIDAWMPAMFPPEEIVNTLGEWLAAHGKRQFRVAETEKYPHVTFFLNGGIETPDPGEERHMAPSPKVRTYDLAPEMSAAEVAEALAGAIRGGYDLIVANFANPDMVGHSGVLEAAVAACEAVDRGLGEALAALDDVGGAMLITADHGNCEVMIDPVSGSPHTAHTTNPVPVLLVGAPGYGLADGRLADLAPTLLELMGLDQPGEMTGRSLLVAP
ncbi:MAG: 2,3-bisphosphoglycerate-independent phosphoglycerate mutase [Pseudomonadota bacterium]